MLKQFISFAFLFSAALFLASNTFPQIKARQSLDHEFGEITRDFFKAIDKQSVRLVKAAIAEYEELIFVSAKTKTDRRVEAAALTKMGEAKALIGQMPAALEHLRDAMEVWESLGDPLEAANVLTTIGNVQYVIRDYQNARDSLERASSLRGSLNPVGELHTKIALGGVYDAIENREKSIESYETALALSRSTGDKYIEGFVLECISIIRKTEEHEYLNRAVQAYREAESKSEIGGSITNHLLSATGNENVRQVRTAARVPIPESLKKLGAKPRSTSEIGSHVPLTYDDAYIGRGPYSLTKIGTIYLSKGDITKAGELYTEALSWSRRIDAWNHEWPILVLLGSYYSRVKDKEKSTYYLTLGNLQLMHKITRQLFQRDGKTIRVGLEHALISIENTRNKLVSEDLRASFAVEVQRHYERYINLLMEMHESEPDGGHDLLALKTAELARSRALLDSLVIAGVDFRAGISPELVRREQEIRSKLNSLAEREARSSSLNQSAEPSQSVSDQISALTIEYAEVHGKIRQEKLKGVAIQPPTPERMARLQSEFRGLVIKDDPTEPLPFAIFDIQSELTDTDTVLLEFYLGDEKSYLWKVTGTMINSYELPGRLEIESLARETYKTIVDSAITSGRLKSGENVSRRAQELSDMILGPVADQIRGKRLVIVADGALQYIPFSALPPPQTKGLRGPLQPLAMTNEIVNLPSAAVLGVLRREAASRTQKGEGVAIVADPVFSDTDERLRKNEAVPIKSKKTDVSRILLERAFSFVREDNKPFSIPRLPFTRREAESIFASASKGVSLKAVDFDADREKVLKTDLSKYRIIHFATHGILQSEHPDLSGIVLSLVNEKGEPVNGFLRLNEIYNMNLNADLVVLSACQTALGKEVRGEGLIGLTRGFMYAGTPRVVASLWKVDDVATAELMKIFYQKMQKEKMRPAAALRAAKVEMIKSKRWNAPYYWAAFELQGDWR